MKKVASLLACLALAACAGAPLPEPVVAGRDMCSFCRMPLSDSRFAAQITADGELPLFFDDPGCLAEFVKLGSLKDPTAVAWVADHRTGGWIRAARAVYTRVPLLATPMNHHLIVHESASSRDADPDARGGRSVEPIEIFGFRGVPGGEKP